MQSLKIRDRNGHAIYFNPLLYMGMLPLDTNPFEHVLCLQGFTNPIGPFKNAEEIHNAINLAIDIDRDSDPPSSISSDSDSPLGGSHARTPKRVQRG